MGGKEHNRGLTLRIPKNESKEVEKFLLDKVNIVNKLKHLYTDFLR